MRQRCASLQQLHPGPQSLNRLTNLPFYFAGLILINALMTLYRSIYGCT
jgi:hypothetical protein